MWLKSQSLWTHVLSGKAEVYPSFLLLLSLHVAEKRMNRAQVGSLNTAVLLITWSWGASGYKTKLTLRLRAQWEAQDRSLHLPKHHTRTRPPSSPSHIKGQFWSHHYREHCADRHSLVHVVILMHMFCMQIHS